VELRKEQLRRLRETGGMSPDRASDDAAEELSKLLPASL
jgi:hypothetical protein